MSISSNLIAQQASSASRHFRKSAVVVALLAIAGCATQEPIVEPKAPLPIPEPVAQEPAKPIPSPEETALVAFVADQDRLYRVAAPLLINNTPLCKGAARNLLGFTAKTRHSYSANYAAAAQSALGLDDKLRVTGVLQNSGAARSGIQRSDVLVSVEGKPMPQGEDAERQAAALLGPLVNGRTALKLGVLRNTDLTQISVPLTPACAYGIELGNVDSVNSYSDGRRVLVTRGMMNFARSDAELAYVIAREMAHNALDHARRQKTGPAFAALIDNLIRINPDSNAMTMATGLKPFTRDQDMGADRLAIYLVARAGYSVDGTLDFWKKVAAQYPATEERTHTALHPSTTSRWQAIEKTLALIKTKKGDPKMLIP